LGINKFYYLLDTELLLERFWHGWWWRSGEVERDLDTVVDEPLEGGEGTDHDDTGTKSLPDTLGSKLLQD
jgi:hypothetical protein